MTEQALTAAPTGAALAEQVVIKGDLSKLTEAERMAYYTAVCNSLGLNPLTRPFEYLVLNGKMILYARKDCTDQLRVVRGITITTLDPRQVGELLVVVATGRDRTGREDSATGAVSTAGLRGENLANAMMKAETKAKRRLTLSLAGLGWTDESEVDSIPGAQRADPPAHLTLAERAAARAASVQATEAEDAEVREVPAPVTRAQFVAAVKARGMTGEQVQAERRRVFPGRDDAEHLTDAEYGELLAAIQTPEVPA